MKNRNHMSRAGLLALGLLLALLLTAPVAAQRPKAQVVTMITGFIELVTPDAWVVGGHILLVNQADIQGEFAAGSVVTMHAYPTPISIWEASIIEPARIAGLNPGEAVIEGLVDSVDGSTIFVGGQSFKRASSAEADVNPLQAAVGMPVRMRTSSSNGTWEVSAVTPAWVGAQADGVDASGATALPLVIVNGQQAADIAAGMFPDSRVTGMALVPTADGGTSWRVQTNAGVSLDINSTDGNVVSVAMLAAPGTDDDGSNDSNQSNNTSNNTSSNTSSNQSDDSNSNQSNNTSNNTSSNTSSNQSDDSNSNQSNNTSNNTSSNTSSNQSDDSNSNQSNNTSSNTSSDDDDNDDDGGDDDFDDDD
ncbi:MAG: hypothetical protein KME04_20860 [Pleurocapsa minor GSE-CHR-MK-17-07R]|nr:hypothetical protein [Pleurocapsa minor GSE-CHR-MK 17-07R]